MKKSVLETHLAYRIPPGATSTRIDSVLHVAPTALPWYATLALEIGGTR